MQTSLPKALLETPMGQEADRILRSCVHCGFCTATCPTYQILGDELDGPRGRIYLIKEMLEGGAVSERTQQHLDRCLTCRSCETTCPSGVRYSHLLDIGREHLQTKVKRSLGQQLIRWGLRKVLPFPNRFGALLKIGNGLRFLLPEKLQRKLPKTRTVNSKVDYSNHSRSVITVTGCVQKSVTPSTHASVVRVLDRLGVTAIEPQGQGCCGAVSQHLTASSEAQGFMRRNIDAWWPYVEDGAEAVVVSASGCSSFVKEYGHLLQHDPEYAEKAKKISEMAKDLSEIIAQEDLNLFQSTQGQRIAYHPPCTLQHGQQLKGVVEDILQRIGFTLTEVSNSHLCCGSAGTYSILQPDLSQQLLSNKLDALNADDPDLIATANIGCQLHIESDSKIPVKHWIELLDESLQKKH